MRESPSLRVAADLRALIASGALAPGDRVPSTREIVRRWGVAVATATRSLAVLRAEGLVRPVPGVGTVVLARSASRAPVARRPAPTYPTYPTSSAPSVAGAQEPGSTTLSAALIVLTAIGVADTEGLDGVSMRRVAAELGAAPMSLYRHVADKDDLVLRMTDAALREARLPDPAPTGWRPRLEIAARVLWATFRRHAWLATTLSLTRPQAIPGGLAYTEWVLEALADGLGATEAFDMHLTLFTFVRGLAINLESEAAAQATSGMTDEEWMVGQQRQLRAMVAGGRHPRFERIVTHDYDFALDRLFELGLRRLLDGLAVELDSHSRPTPRR